MFLHNSHDASFRKPSGPAVCGQKVTITFLCDEGKQVYLRTWDGHESVISMQETDENTFEAELTMPDQPMLFWYDFFVLIDSHVVRYGAPDDHLGGVGQCYENGLHSFQITVYDPDFTTPEYLHQGILYQIFPDRFSRSLNCKQIDADYIAKAHPEAEYHTVWDEPPALNPDPSNGDNQALDFFGGNLKGIIEKLPYLKSLGVTVLYLNPVFRARTNHRYDTGSYEETDPILGTEEELTELFREAEKQGIHVLLDGVFSHTGADSKYFNRFSRYPDKGAWQGNESPYFDWYTFYDFPYEYNSWWGFYTLPAMNKDNESYQEYLLNPENGIIPARVRQGSYGWRLDVVDELPMNLVSKMRSAIKAEKKDAVLLGEVWEDASAKIAYEQLRSYCLGDTLDSVMNYPLRRNIIDFFTGVIDAHQFARFLNHQKEVYPAPFLYSLMNLLGSHDRVRALNAFSGYDCEGIQQMDRSDAMLIKLTDEEKKFAKMRLVEAYRLLCALPGMPAIYYGDEIGMEGMADPWNRAPMAWDHVDEDLLGRISKLLSWRKSEQLMMTGYYSVRSLNNDTLEIIRHAENGLDIFGNVLEREPITVTISRNFETEE